MTMITAPRFNYAFFPKLHPFITGPTMFLSRIPSDVSCHEVAQVLSPYGTFTSTVHLEVEPSARMLPDPHYNGMPYHMLVNFHECHSFERALACFPSTPLALRGITISLRPDLLPIPKANPGVAARQINLKSFYDIPHHPTDLQLFDAARQWGSIEELNLVRVGRYWTCRLQFYYEDEASRFELEFPKASFLGWDVTVSTVSTEMAPRYAGGPTQCDPPQLIPSVLFSGLRPFTHHIPAPTFAHYMPNHYAAAYPEAAAVAGFAPKPRALSMEIPQGIPMVTDREVRSLPMPTKPLPPVTVTPRITRPASIWVEYQDYDSDGVYKTMGLKDQYNQKIPHKKGQHIRKVKAELHSSGKPGYVDYCNLRIKGLGADINDLYFREVCQVAEGFVGSSVNRDEKGRSRGHGFANYETLDQAKQAMTVLQGQKCGAKKLVVTFHEPTKLKPDKIFSPRPANGPG